MSSAQGEVDAAGGEMQRDELHTALHQRLVQTGEWHRIMAALRASLDESGWTSALRDQAQSRW